MGFGGEQPFIKRPAAENGKFNLGNWQDHLRERLGGALRRRGMPSPGKVVVGLAVTAVLLVGGCFLLRPDPAPVVLPRATAVIPSTSTTALPPQEVELFVHAAGAVLNPGVYRLADGARVVDLLQASGGASPEADLARVNLASPLSDGVQVFFPYQGINPPPPPEGASGPASEPAEAGPLDINTASVSELQNLPGVGPVIAAAIVEHRSSNGPFATVDDLLGVSGVGQAKLELLRPRVAVSP